MRMLISFLFLFFINIAYPANQTVGSDTTSGGAISYLQLDGANNKIANYALMSNGFSLFDLSSSASFNSTYPVAGGFFVQGGKLFLNRDLVLDSHYIFGGGGQFYGNNYSLIFNNPDFDVEFFKGNFGAFNLIDQYDTGSNVWTVDWSYDDLYVASGSQFGTELYVYSFDGTTLNPIYSLGYADDVNTLRWHPDSYVLAIGVQGVSGDDLFIYSWNGATLTLLDSVEGGNIRAIDWSKDGNYLAVGEGDDDVVIYSWNGSTLTQVDIYRITGGRVAIDRNSLEWDSTGQYIAVALYDTGGNTLRVLSFDGTNLTQDAQINIGSRGENVSWRPNSDIIAIGLSASTERLRLYRHSPSSLIEITSARVGEAYSVFDVDWSHDGNYLLVARDDRTGDDFFNYYFNEYNEQLLLLTSREATQDVYSMRWSHDDQYYSLGSMNDNAYVYGFNRSNLYFYDTNLFFNSNLNMKLPVYFRNCTLNLNGNRINLMQDSLINVIQGSNLTIKNAEIYGLSKQNLRCLSDNSSIIFENCKLTLTSDYLFDIGSISFLSDVIISGTNCFTYASRKTSTIDSFSVLYFEQGMTFSYSPKNNKNNLIYMPDFTSKLFLNGTTLKTTTTGICLTNGSLLLDNKVTFSAVGKTLSESICFGDGTFENNLNVSLLSSALLNIYGPFEYNNIN